MPRSAIPGLAEGIITWLATSSPSWEITMHCRTADGSANTATKLSGLQAALDGLVTGTWTAAQWNNSQTLQFCIARDLSPARLPDAVGTHAIVGTRGTSVIANDSCLVVTEKSDFVGRAFRGRTFFSGFVTADLISPSSFSSALAEEFEDHCEELRAAMAAATPTGYTPVLYHRLAGQGGTPPADSTTPITGSLGRQVVASQRRRTRPIRR